MWNVIINVVIVGLIVADLLSPWRFHVCPSCRDACDCGYAKETCEQCTRCDPLRERALEITREQARRVA